jgi:hypothetical protein
MNSATAATPRIADGLSLAASPCFAAMALITAIQGDVGALLCTGQGSWSIGGMAPMYALMSLFHAAPWLRRITR